MSAKLNRHQELQLQLQSNFQRVHEFINKLIEADKTTPAMLVGMGTLCKIFLFREVPTSCQVLSPADKLELPHSDHPEWPQLHLMYLLLKKCLTDAKLKPGQCREACNKQLVLQLMRLFHSQDMRERILLEQVIGLLYEKFKQLRQPIWQQLTNHLIDYQQGIFLFCHSGTQNVLSLVGLLLQLQPADQRFGLPQEQLLFRVLLPLYKHNNLSDIRQPLGDALVQCQMRAPWLSTRIMQRLLEYWPCTSSDEVMFLEAMLWLVQTMPLSQLHTVIPTVFTRLGHCLSSTSKKLHDYTYAVLLTPIFFELLFQHEQHFVQLIFPQLYITSTQHWNLQVRCNAGRLCSEINEAAKLQLISRNASQLWPKPRHSLRKQR